LINKKGDQNMDSEVLNMGGGSGGGDDDGPNIIKTADRSYQIAANQVVLLTRPPTDPDSKPVPNVITILATGNTATDGNVDVRGSKGVRITSGPPLLPPTKSDSTDGVEIVVSESQNVTVQRGLLPGVDQKISMTPGNITIDGGTGTITIQSLTEITLSVAGGLSSITLTPAGITIQGILVQIN
jgi:hypothetical protein